MKNFFFKRAEETSDHDVCEWRREGEINILPNGIRQVNASLNFQIKSINFSCGPRAREEPLHTLGRALIFKRNSRSGAVDCVRWTCTEDFNDGIGNTAAVCLLSYHTKFLRLSPALSNVKWVLSTKKYRTTVNQIKSLLDSPTWHRDLRALGSSHLFSLHFFLRLLLFFFNVEFLIAPLSPLCNAELFFFYVEKKMVTKLNKHRFHVRRTSSRSGARGKQRDDIGDGRWARTHQAHRTLSWARERERRKRSVRWEKVDVKWVTFDSWSTRAATQPQQQPARMLNHKKWKL